MTATVIPLDPWRRTRDVESMLHDMRGPLTVIRGQCHAIVRRGGRNGDLIGRLGLIDAEVDRIAAAIDDLRAAVAGTARPDTGDAVDLRALVHETVRRHEGNAGERAITLRVETHRARVMVAGRLDELRRVLDNLLINAVQHAPYGSTVTLTCTSAAGAGEVAIANDGAAPPRPTPIRWAFPASDHGTDGWGMGIGIVDDLVADHAGTVVVAPAGSGPCVTVSLPLLAEDRG